MLRFKVLVSAVPLIVAAILAHLELLPDPRPCIVLGQQAVELAPAPWHADLHVSFTDDPRLATVRVAVTDDASAADFAIVDDANAADGAACETASARQFIAIRPDSVDAAPPVIYLSHDEQRADYRVYVHSRRFTARDAAALIVGAHDQHPTLDAS